MEDESRNLRAVYDLWREARWHHEVLCRILDAEMELFLAGKSQVPLSHLDRLQSTREDLQRKCEALVGRLRAASRQQ